MKRMIMLLMLGAVLAVGEASAEPQVGGPKGGKLLENESPKAEFFVEQDHKVSLTFYDDHLKTVPVSGQIASATVDASGKKVKIDFEKKGDILISKTALPEGDGYNIVLQLKRDDKAKVENFRIKYDTHICGECQRMEYACTCDE